MGEKIERIDTDFADWIRRISSKRHANKLDKKPKSIGKITNEMMHKRSMEDLERELLGEPHIRDILGQPKKNKRGSIMDLILWMVVAFIVAIFFAGFILMFNSVGNAMLTVPDVPAFHLHDSINATFTKVSAAMPILKWAALVFIFAMIISIFISNFLIKVHPVFFIVYLLITIVSVIFAAYLSNAYEMVLTGNNELVTTLQTFTGVNWVMLNLPYFAAVIGIFGSILLFINIIRDGGGGGGISVI